MAKPENPLEAFRHVLTGGTSPDANARRVAVFRQIDGRRQAAAFDLASIRRGEMPDPPVYAGDIVVVDGSSLKQVQKQILNSMPILSIFKTRCHSSARTGKVMPR